MSKYRIVLDWKEYGKSVEGQPSGGIVTYHLGNTSWFVFQPSELSARQTQQLMQDCLDRGIELGGSDVRKVVREALLDT